MVSKDDSSSDEQTEMTGSVVTQPLEGMLSACSIKLHTPASYLLLVTFLSVFPLLPRPKFRVHPTPTAPRTANFEKHHDRAAHFT